VTLRNALHFKVEEASERVLFEIDEVVEVQSLQEA